MYNVSVNLHYCPNEYLVVHEQESDVLDPRRTEKKQSSVVYWGSSTSVA